ncbi:hypothetical protein GGR50DRAFT_690591 [Xylaria sp. CBS 124048]|nr:hypothetical protein GGR50DRAFT_690591 [Xylaria sp. CBS 124048]
MQQLSDAKSRQGHPIYQKPSPAPRLFPRANPHHQFELGEDVKPILGSRTKKQKDPLAPATQGKRSQPRSKRAGKASNPLKITPPSFQNAMLIPRPTGMSSNGKLRVLETHLMQHYAQTVALQMPAAYNCSSRQLWLDIVPQVAFESELLLDSVLALSATHLHDLLPQDKQLGIAANYYLDRALVKHRKAISGSEGMKKSPDGPLFISALMIAIITWQYAHRQSSPSSYHIPLESLAITRGCFALHHEYDEWLSQASFDMGDMLESLSADINSPAPPTRHPLRSEFEQDMKKLLEAFDVLHMPPDDAAAYQTAAKAAVSVHVALLEKIDGTSSQRLIFKLATCMGSHFLRLLDAREPLALAIFTRLVVLLSSIDDLWWSRGNNSRVLRASIHGMIGWLPAEYTWVMDWPLKALNREEARVVEVAEPRPVS